jgi:hypothetical protein
MKQEPQPLLTTRLTIISRTRAWLALFAAEPDRGRFV